MAELGTARRFNSVSSGLPVSCTFVVSALGLDVLGVMAVLGRLALLRLCECSWRQGLLWCRDVDAVRDGAAGAASWIQGQEEGA